MGEAMARALGAKGAKTVMIGGKECIVRPLGMRELTEVERDCLERYKRQYLKTWADNLDLLPPEAAAKLMEKKLEECSRWDVDNLPPKTAHDPRRVKLTEKLRERMAGWLAVAEGDEGRERRLIASALDQGILSASDYRELTGESAPGVAVPYVNWWITGSYDGMISFVWKCFSQYGVTRDEVMEAVRGNLQMLAEVAQEIERLSAPQLGNG